MHRRDAVRVLNAQNYGNLTATRGGHGLTPWLFRAISFRRRDSNPNMRNQNPLSCHWTTPECRRAAYGSSTQTQPGGQVVATGVVLRTLVARPSARLSQNAPGDFFVDDSCIDCETCRVLAPRDTAEHRPEVGDSVDVDDRRRERSGRRTGDDVPIDSEPGTVARALPLYG